MSHVILLYPPQEKKNNHQKRLHEANDITTNVIRYGRSLCVAGFNVSAFWQDWLKAIFIGIYSLGISCRMAQLLTRI